MIVGRVRRTVRERRLFERGDKVVVACSGGPDSGALLDVLVRLAGEPELGLELVAASVNHGLRPEAERDVEIAASLAKQLGVTFHALRIDVPPGASVQAAARVARYEALAKLALEVSATKIATGHTMDDQAETVIARLLRGAGVRGIAGIAPRRLDGIVRPLIDARRSETRAWADRQGLPYTDDSSNADPRFLRVRVRSALLPALAAENPAIVPHLAALADDARAEARLVDRAGKRLLLRATLDDGALDMPSLVAAPSAARQRALAIWLGTEMSRRPRRAHLEAIEHAVLTHATEAEVPLGTGVVAVFLKERVALRPAKT